MSDLLDTAKDMEVRLAASLAIAEDLEAKARRRADLQRRRLLVLRQFMESWSILDELPEPQEHPVATPADPPRSETAAREDAGPDAPEQSVRAEGPSPAEAAPLADESATGGEVVDLPAFLNSPAMASEKVGGSSAAAAPLNAEEAERNPAYAQWAGVERGTDRGVTAGETATNPDPDPAPLAVETEAATASSGDGVALSVGEAVAPASSSRQGPQIKDWVKAVHDEHPDWSNAEIARALDLAPSLVSRALKKLGIYLSAPVPLADRVAKYHQAHPEATSGEIAKALEAKPASVRTAALARGITLPKLSPERRSDIAREARRGQKVKGKGPRAYVAPIKAPKAANPPPAPRVHSPPAPPVETEEEAGGADVTSIAGTARKAPTGQQFYLKDGFGNYLHWSAQMLTDERKQAWTGSKKQADACREKFAVARNLKLSAVPKRRDPLPGVF